jgi:stearoyl-CoA desaturase (delta-9 desaturase)
LADGASSPKPARSAVRRLGRAFIAWFDTGPHVVPKDGAPLPDIPDRVEWARILPFIGMHLACFAVIWVGWSPVAVGVAVAAYLVRMFAITGFYHRYFSHRSFKTSRVGQFIFCLLGASSV